MEFLENQAKAVEYLRFWLFSVKMHSDGAPLLVIGTFKDSLESPAQIEQINVELREVLKRFPQVVANDAESLCFFPLNNKDGGGEDIKHIRRVIEQETRKQDHVHQPISSRWTRFLDKLFKTDEDEEDGQVSNWVSLEEAVVVANSVGVLGEQEIEEMLQMFHQLGVIVHLTHTEQMKNVITLNPQWLIDAISKVIRDDALHQYDEDEIQKKGLMTDLENLFRRGLASIDLLEYLWVKDEVDFLLDLMKQTLLISEWDFGGGEPLFLVPCMVKSASEMPFQKALSRSCKMDFSKSYLPTGVFQRLVCLCVSESNRQDGAREPMLFDSSARVWFGPTDSFYLFQEENCIRLTVSNRSARSSMRFLAVLLAMMKKIKVEVMGQGLEWDVLLERDRDQYISYEEAKRLSLRPWFKEPKESSSELMSSLDKRNLDNFMDN